MELNSYEKIDKDGIVHIYNSIVELLREVSFNESESKYVEDFLKSHKKLSDDDLEKEIHKKYLWIEAPYQGILEFKPKPKLFGSKHPVRRWSQPHINFKPQSSFESQLKALQKINEAHDAWICKKMHMKNSSKTLSNSLIVLLELEN